MALGSSSVPIHMQETPTEENQARSSPRAQSARSGGGLREIEEEPVETLEIEAVGEEERVYVAVGKEYKEGKSVLVWALQNISRESTVVILHVHRPAHMIPIMGARFPASQLTEAEVRAYRQIEMKKVNKGLEGYLTVCSQAKVRTDKIVIEMDDIVKGIVEMISLHGISKLVMGAGADRHYSRSIRTLLFKDHLKNAKKQKMEVPKSKTATSVQQLADPSCSIWFVCKGNLIQTRESGLSKYGFLQSPATTQSVLQSPATSQSSMSSPYEQLRSRSSIQTKTESMNWLLSPRQEILRCRSRSVNSDSRELGIMTATNAHVKIGSPSMEGNVIDPWESFSRRSLASNQSSCYASDEALSNIGSQSMLKNEKSEEGLTMPLVHESDEDRLFSSTRYDLEDAQIDGEVYDKLQNALREAKSLRREAYEESRRRQKTERDAIESARKAKASETLYINELKQRKEIEETLAREMLELENLKIQRNNVFEELQKVRDRESELQLQIANSNCITKDLEAKLSAAHLLLNSLQQEYDKLQQERDYAVREVEELCQRKDGATSGSTRSLSFSEFSLSELEQATSNFDDSMKIGEGGYGSVYKGFLRHTTVAIKILNPQSMQGHTEFHQEVDVLSRARHPHLVMLIGTCLEAFALVYEYCSYGSLEDCLSCMNNTAPLTWQVRTRVAAEICSALIFLHSNKPLSVVHGDIKPANILIDANFVCKLADFGICRLLAQSNSTTTLYCHTQPKGTFVYMDPEFLASGEITPSSDVYSFGVILLRLLTGKPALGLIKEVGEALSEGRLHGILDTTAGDWPFVQANQFAHLALRCCERKRKKRPDLVLDAWKVLEPMVKAASPTGSSSLTRGLAPEDSRIPSYFICPIFQEVMNDPHIAADGFTYEAEALRGWLDSGHDTSPMTNLKLPHADLIPNRALRSVIQEWLQWHP